LLLHSIQEDEKLPKLKILDQKIIIGLLFLLLFKGFSLFYHSLHQI